jgi:tetratricopeptide (TPR) repeat protein
MSAEERLNYLRGLLAEEPEEAFIHYAICLELAKQNREDALPAYRKLLSEFPDYLPAYYQLSLLLAESGLTSEALSCAEKGIHLAQEIKDLHALAELKGLRQDILTGDFE